MTVGDSIFHCHFYPHFAQGMWALWRVHDVFELGTQLDDSGRPRRARAPCRTARSPPARRSPPSCRCPHADGAAARRPGVRSSAARSQLTGAGNPGYPFFVPGIAGHRPPNPPLDAVDDRRPRPPRSPRRHGVRTTTTPFDFSKDFLTLNVDWLPEDRHAGGEAAMAFHAQPLCRAATPTGTPGNFSLNGKHRDRRRPLRRPLPAQCAGAHLPSAADIQLDVIFNKEGWHFAQQRISSLWQDVNDYLDHAAPTAEPLFFRANSGDCIGFWLTNLVPDYYELDDFQVRTPTDIIGQHIHLVKFDVLASDGAANGYNYEDGSFSPGEVRERIAAIRAQNGCALTDSCNSA